MAIGGSFPNPSLRLRLLVIAVKAVLKIPGFRRELTAQGAE